MLKNEDSLRLQLLRFPLIVAVVFIHAYTLANDPFSAATGPNHVNAFIQTLISQELARCAVPLFFLMSGYLFFVGADWSMEKYKSKIRSRIGTLLIPFLFWNILVLLLFAIAQSHPKTAPFFSGKMALVRDYSLVDYISTVFGINRLPASYQFWFIRDLMVLALLTPLIHPLLKKIPTAVLAVLLILWFVHAGGTTSESTLFFILGAWASIWRHSLFSLDQQAKWMLPVYLAVVIANSAWADTQAYPYLHKIGILLGMPVFLLLTKAASSTTGLKNALVALGSASFFVFAAHEPLLTMIRKILYKLLQPQHNGKILLIYFLSVTASVVICTGLFFLLNRLVPRFAKVIAGGR